MTEIHVLQMIKGLDIGGVNGGAERFSIDLCGQLRNLGCKVDLCAFYKMNTPAESAWLEILNDRGQDVFFATSPYGKNYLRNFVAGSKFLREFVERKQPVILHSHFQQGTYAALWLKKVLSVPVVVRTAHNVLEWEPGFSGKVKEAISDFIYPRWLDAEVGVSKTIVDQLAERYPAHSKNVRPVLAFNGIVLPSIAEFPTVITTEETGFIIGAVGRLAEQKGYNHLLAAMVYVLGRHPGAKLVFLGDGELHSVLEAQTRQLNLGDCVEFAGQVNNVLERLRNFNLFVSSSLWEGLPSVIIEAMAIGLPVVATDIPGTREIISDGVNGKLVQPHDPLALADAIIEMIDNPQMRRELSHAGQQSVKQFSIEEIAKTYLKLYESLLSNEIG